MRVSDLTRVLDTLSGHEQCRPLCWTRAAAFCGIRASMTYEGQAAIASRGRADSRNDGRYPIAVSTRTIASSSILATLVLAVARDDTHRVARRRRFLRCRIHHGLVYAATLAARAAP